MATRLIIIDTNFLLLPFRYKINIIKELDRLVEKNHQLVISSRTMGELRMIGRRIGKDGMAARLAIKMIEAAGKGFTVVENSDIVDDWIVSYASENNAMVCTNDSELRRRLKAMKLKVITMKSKSRIGFV